MNRTKVEDPVKYEWNPKVEAPAGELAPGFLAQQNIVNRYMKSKDAPKDISREVLEKSRKRSRH